MIADRRTGRRSRLGLGRHPARRVRPGRRGIRVSPRLLLALAAVVLIAGGGFLWFRDSSLVAVRRVTITGVSGPDATQVRSALTLAARDMTTLDVELGRLRSAVQAYPVVKGIRVSTAFPHGMTIDVQEQVPIAVIVDGGVRTAVTADGTLLRDAAGTSGLPSVTVADEPNGNRVSGGTLDVVRLLAAAPYAALAKVQSAGDGPIRGLVAQLRDGPRIYFGTGTELAAKWQSALLVLGSPHAAGASYIDVSDPRLPAAGSGSD